MIAPRATLTNKLPLTRSAACDIYIEQLGWVRPLSEAACQAPSMRPLRTSHYKQQINAQIAAIDSDGEGLSDCTLRSERGGERRPCTSRPQRRLTIYPL